MHQIPFTQQSVDHYKRANQQDVDLRRMVTGRDIEPAYYDDQKRRNPKGCVVGCVFFGHFLYSYKESDSPIGETRSQLNHYMKSECIQYLTPETKGRILYDLLTVAHSWQEDLGNLVNRKINQSRENATVLLIEKGIHSLDDWRETFEHVGDWDGDQLVFAIKTGAEAPEKAERVRRNIEAVQARLLDDPEKLSTVMDHYQTLVDKAATTEKPNV